MTQMENNNYGHPAVCIVEEVKWCKLFHALNISTCYCFGIEQSEEKVISLQISTFYLFIVFFTSCLIPDKV